MTEEELRKSLDFVCEERDRLQERIEKAINELKTTYNKEYYYKYNGKYLKSEITTDLLNILNGRSDE